MNGKITNVYELRSAYYNKHPDGHYFDYETLKFFGETLSSMRVLKNTAEITDYSGNIHTCYVLSKLSKTWDGRKRRKYDYFDITTLDHIPV